MKLLAAALLALALVACAGPRPASDPTTVTTSAQPPTDVAGVLTGYHWQLASATDAAGARIAALLVRPERPVTLTFNGRGVAVQNACNAMHAQYTLAGDTLELDRFLSTMMACADPAVSALDRAVTATLHGPLTLAIDTRGARPRLALTTSSGERLTFDGTPTAATRYGSEGEVEFLEVAAAPIACPNGAPGAQCLNVREVHYDAQGLRTGEPGPWHALGEPIEGYTHQPGVRNVLRVRRFTIAHPERHGANVAYVLDMVVESEITPRK
jgi:heat shock protein HslJ